MQEITIKFGSSPDRELRDEIQRWAAEDFGGSTLVEGRGSWRGDDKIVFDEPAYTLFVTVLDDYDGSMPPNVWARTVAKYVRDSSSEDAVYWDVTEIEHGGIV